MLSVFLVYLVGSRTRGNRIYIRGAKPDTLFIPENMTDPAWPGAHCTTECLYLYTHGWWDESHPDTSISDVFQTYLLGVEPLEPGFRTFRLVPQPPNDLAWARGSVPTPHGMIEVGWRREETGECGQAVRAPATLSISVPDGTTAVLSDGRILGPGHHELSIPQPKEKP